MAQDYFEKRQYWQHYVYSTLHSCSPKMTTTGVNAYSVKDNIGSVHHPCLDRHKVLLPLNEICSVAKFLFAMILIVSVYEDTLTLSNVCSTVLHHFVPEPKHIDLHEISSRDIALVCFALCAFAKLTSNRARKEVTVADTEARSPLEFKHLPIFGSQSNSIV